MPRKTPPAPPGGAPATAPQAAAEARAPRPPSKRVVAIDAGAMADHFKAIIQSSDDAIISKDLDGIVTSWNPGATAIFGYTAEEMLGQPMMRLFPPDRQTEELVILERIVEGHKVDHFESVRMHKDGHLINVAVTISPIRDLAGQIVGASKIARDITERVQLERTLRHFEAIVTASDDAIVSKTLEGIVTFWNAGAERIFGWSAEEMIGSSILKLIPPGRESEETEILRRLRAGESIEQFETERLRKDGRRVYVSLTISPIRSADGRVTGASKIARDVTERRAIEERLELTSSVFTHISEAVVITDGEGIFLDVNQAFTRVTGYAREEVLGRSAQIFRSGRQNHDVYLALAAKLRETGTCHGEIWSRTRTGESFAGLLTVSAIGDASGAPSRYVAVFADITPLRQHQERLEHIAHFDPLTDLPNRILLADRLAQSMAAAQRQHRQLAVAYLDLDGFKAINDRYGHDSGDELLVNLSRRLQAAFRAVDTLARMGGDEFVAVLTDIRNMDECVLMLERILAICAEPLVIDGQLVQISASIGVTLFPQDNSDVDQLIRHADQAMYDAKQSGKNRFHVFDSARDVALKTRGEKINRIAQGLQDREFRLHYQPIVDMRSGQLIGAEALLRWQHPDLGLLPPADFLPLIEDHGLIEAVGDWVIGAALEQIEEWQAAGFSPTVSINISARQFRAQDFTARLAARLAAKPGVLPGRVMLELLETSALENIDVVAEIIDQCRALGVQFAMDDFGTGYSPLTYLRRLRAQTLKIDQTFVRGMLRDAGDLEIVKAVIGLADAFNLRVVAEGVETVAHGTRLLGLGCTLAQGFGIARPMPPEALRDWARAWRPPQSWRTAGRKN